MVLKGDKKYIYIYFFCFSGVKKWYGEKKVFRKEIIFLWVYNPGGWIAGLSGISRISIREVATARLMDP